jgi:hypothetical protein
MSKSGQPDARRVPPPIPAAAPPDADAAPVASDLPIPPRAVTPLVRRRSWTEPSVRFWWLASLVLLIIGVWFFLTQAREYQRERWLISNGTPVNAIIADANGDSRVGAKFPPGTECTLRFSFGGQNISVSGMLDTFITNGQTVVLHVNPADPTEWTFRSQADPLNSRLSAGAVIAVAVLATGATALWLRRRVLRVWRDAAAIAYTVVDTRHSALAPLSHAVRCTMLTGRNTRLLTVYLPGKLPRPSSGEILWLLHPPSRPSAAIAAQAYQ